MKKYITLFITILLSIQSTFSVSLSTIIPDTWERIWISWDFSILDIIAMVNSYLRFWIWFFCFLFMIWNWYKLISANLDEKATGSATKALIWCTIWIAICLLAYVIVNIAVNLFAK